MKTLSNAMLASALMAGALMAQQYGPPDPATMVQRQVERLTAVLSLTSSQVTQATTIFTNAETSITPIRTNVQTYRTSLQTAVKGNQLATIDQLAGQIGTAEGQILGIQSKADASFLRHPDDRSANQSERHARHPRRRTRSRNGARNGTRTENASGTVTHPAPPELGAVRIG